MLMLPEKDDDGRQVLILRPGDHYILWFSAADGKPKNVYWLQCLRRYKFSPATALYFELGLNNGQWSFVFTVFQPNNTAIKLNGFFVSLKVFESLIHARTPVHTP